MAPLLLVLLAPLLPSCGLFAPPDAAPLVAGVEAMEAAFDNQTAAFRRLVGDPQNGMTPEVRGVWASGIDKNEAQHRGSAERTKAAAEAMGAEVDWKSAYERLKKQLGR